MGAEFNPITERCDNGKCPAVGWVEFLWADQKIPQKGESPTGLIFCKHHGDKLEVTLLSKGFILGRDNRPKLTESNVSDV